MILIDSIYVNTGGSLVLLKHLVSELEKLELDVFYLFDERTESVFSHIDSEKCKFIKNNNFLRARFYKKFDFSNVRKVFCFGNAPPVITLKVPVYVYFHNPTLIHLHSDMNIKTKFSSYIKQLFINFFKNNVNIWFVQSQYMQQKLASKYFNNRIENIKIIPFYPEITYPNDVERIDNTFLYVSTSYPHKNHIRLIEAFCNAYDNLKTGKLILTVPFSNKIISSFIDNKICQGYPILNLGFVNREDLFDIYKSSEYLIFPSLAETFGLGLAEAIDAGCKVLAADLPYTYEVCKPSLTFDPFLTFSIQEAIEFAIENRVEASIKLIKNDIMQLIDYLK